MYLGERKIKNTTTKNDLVQVFFHPIKVNTEDGKSVQETPKSILTSQEFVDALQTEESLPNEEYAKSEMAFFTKKFFIEVAEKHNARVFIINKVAENIALSLFNHTEEKINNLFGKNEYERRILDLELK